MMISYTASREGLDGLEDFVDSMKRRLFTDSVEEAVCILHCEKKNEGFKTASKVQYVARSGNFIDGGAQYSGALQILKVILSYEYLWQNIRVKGGAYGCMSNFNRIGEGYFVSYRDPNLKRTMEIYEGITDYLKNFTVSERDMTKYIIGTISNIDQPMTPSAKGDRSMNLYMNHVSPEMIQRERSEILEADQEDIRALAPVVKALLAADQICVIGSEEKIETDKDMFDVLTSFLTGDVHFWRWCLSPFCKGVRPPWREKMRQDYKSGFVTLIGRPNVGKSTLMNYLIGQKIAITSNKPQTTRNRIQTVLTTEEGQIVFVDTPGIHKAKNKLGKYMVNVAERTLKEVDVILWLVEPTTFIGAGEQHIAQQLKE